MPAGPAPKASGVVVVSQRLGALTEEERRVEQAGWELRSAPLWDLQQIAVNGVDADVIVLGAVEPFDSAALEALPNCWAIVRRGVGVDNVDVAAATRLGVLVANVPDATVEEVSDHALALLLAAERRIPSLDRAVHDGEWQHDPKRIQARREGMRRLSELTLGILGLGRIGQALARKARPIYRRMLAADPFTKPMTAASMGAELVEIETLLGSADHISLHMPLLPETTHLVDAEALKRMRTGVVIVNTARGGLVDEAALLDALATAKVAMAALDVTEQEPLPADSPLLGDHRLLLTAHSAAWSATAARELARRSMDAVIDLIAGRTPEAVVNPDVFGSPHSRVPWLSGTRE